MESQAATPTTKRQFHQSRSLFAKLNPSFFILYHIAICFLPIFTVSRNIHAERNHVVLDGVRYPKPIFLSLDEKLLSAVEKIRWDLSFPQIDGPAMASSLLTGITTQWSSAAFTTLKPWGLAHVVAASGVNVRMFCISLLFLVGRPKPVIPFLSPLLAITYFILTGKESTVGRATYLFLAQRLISFLPFYVSPFSLTAWVFSSEAILFPEHLENLSFYLSLVAIVYLLRFRSPWTLLLPIVMQSLCALGANLSEIRFSLSHLLIGAVLGFLIAIVLLLCSFFSFFLPKIFMDFEWLILKSLDWADRQTPELSIRFTPLLLFKMISLLTALRLLWWTGKSRKVSNH